MDRRIGAAPGGRTLLTNTPAACHISAPSGHRAIAHRSHSSGAAASVLVRCQHRAQPSTCVAMRLMVSSATRCRSPACPVRRAMEGATTRVARWAASHMRAACRSARDPIPPGAAEWRALRLRRVEGHASMSGMGGFCPWCRNCSAIVHPFVSGRITRLAYDNVGCLLHRSRLGPVTCGYFVFVNPNWQLSGKPGRSHEMAGIFYYFYWVCVKFSDGCGTRCTGWSLLILEWSVLAGQRG